MKKSGKKLPPKPTTGRPKGDIQRNVKLPVRFSPPEVDQIRKDATAVGVTLTVYVRRKLGLPDTGYGSAST